MEAKRTPGPWKMGGYGKNARYAKNPTRPIYETTSNKLICRVPGRFDGDWDAGYAITRLIAKAWLIPDLLAALSLYLKLDNDRRAGCEIGPKDWAECHQAAMSAIAKTKED